MTGPRAEAPRAFILSTGSELTQGSRTDTNATELSAFLTAEGFRVVGHAAVPDELPRIVATLRVAFEACDLLVMTGGIGPTEDDLCREALAEALGVGLHRVARAETMMRLRFVQRGRPMPERNLKQALLPDGTLPIANHWGTAMGILVPGPKRGRPLIVAMPGVPREWRAMWARLWPRRVAPAFPTRPRMASTTVHVAGMAESEVNAALLSLFQQGDPEIDLGMLASPGHIRVRVAAQGITQAEAEARRDDTARRVRDLLPPRTVFAEGDDALTLEAVVVERFRHLGATLALAESCTGGGVAHRLTDVPNASQVLIEAWVTYSNGAKTARLGVRPETLERDGAVSETCVREMAAGALAASCAHVAVAVSGIAGPGGGSPEKPVGLVWLGLADSNGRSLAEQHAFAGDRWMVRARAESAALDLLRRWAEDNAPTA
jgi:nicotinamide-nucleotide amidase